MLKLDNQLCFSLYASSRALTKVYQPILKEMGLTYPQYLVLLVLWEKSRETVNELGKKLRLDSGTLTPLLKRLEKSGFVKRTRSKQDERKVLVNLTEKGIALKKKALSIPERMICRLGVSLEMVNSLKSSLDHFLESVTANNT